ncbi:MAG TPA: phasin family protein [Geminicoccaceae bacterium]
MAETDTGATAGEHLVEAAKEGGKAVTQAVGKVADVALSVVRGSSGRDETAAAAGDAAHGGGLELVRRTAAAAGEAQRETARQAAEGAAELGRLYTGLIEEQLRHNQQAVAALGRAVSVDWDEAVRAQGEFVRASLERLARLNDRHLEIVRAVMAAASAAADGTRPVGPPKR